MPTFRELLGMSPSAASPSDSALVIIDAQKEYATGKLAVTDIKSTSAKILELLERYRAANGKIVHILHRTSEGAPIFTPDTELAEELDILAPKPGEETVWKPLPGSFSQTDLQSILDKWGVKKLVLTGYMAHVCVSTTAREGFQLGYDVVIAEDAVGDRDIPGAKGEDVTKMVLHELADVFGTVVKSDDIK
ncbi:Isochorismatase hydrolase [Aulographum hederae CBS 113979]|uniref:Isochorismatase hydrolase n=1 Tax=Aulographum hederae CBS 113979 TaxID=1176131 RepID=A0A6G1GSW8_9PEZI|nr:Isochorismatase hydrolase [Aulographum hederae CBS 113979]